MQGGAFVRGIEDCGSPLRAAGSGDGEVGGLQLLEHTGPPRARLTVPFLQVHLDLGALDPEAAEQACFDTGALSVTLADAADTPILEPAPGATPLWPSVALSALYDVDTDREALTAALREALAAPALEPRYEELADRPWEREWLKDFRPMRFGQRLWICPGGQTPPPEAADAVVILLDPGLAFGTGTHATTALCLEWLDGRDLQGARVYDVGCGSGILAIAALALGAGSAVAMDIDPQALLATRENAERNRVEARLQVRPADAPWDAGFDVVLANILAEPLIELAPRLAAATRAGGHVVLSGLLAAQAESVASAFAPWFDMDPPRERDGWAGLTGRRRN
jgi:ribosomal protein L11 methyltransferase